MALSGTPKGAKSRTKESCPLSFRLLEGQVANHRGGVSHLRSYFKGFPSKTLFLTLTMPALARDSGFWLQIPKVRDRAFFVTVFSAFCPEPTDMWVSKDQNSEGVVPLSSTEQDHRVRSQ